MIFLLINIFRKNLYEQIKLLFRHIFCLLFDVYKYFIIVICDYSIQKIYNFKSRYVDEILNEFKPLPFEIEYISDSCFIIELKSVGIHVEEALNLIRLKLERTFTSWEVGCNFLTLITIEDDNGKTWVHSFGSYHFYKRIALSHWIIHLNQQIEYSMVYFKGTRCIGVKIVGNLSFPDKKLLKLLVEAFRHPYHDKVDSLIGMIRSYKALTLRKNSYKIKKYRYKFFPFKKGRV